MMKEGARERVHRMMLAVTEALHYGLSATNTVDACPLPRNINGNLNSHRSCPTQPSPMLKAAQQCDRQVPHMPTQNSPSSMLAPHRPNPGHLCMCQQPPSTVIQLGL
jgi:hypothetical protein